MRKQVMSLAWALIKAANNTINNLSDALKAAWKAIKAKAAINAGGAIVTFRKADGSIACRVAKAFIGPVKGTGKSNPLTVLYTEIATGLTKSFRADRLVSFVTV